MKKIQYLQNKVYTLEEKNDELSAVINFLCDHDRNDIDLSGLFSWGKMITSAKYLYNSKVMRTSINCQNCELVKNSSDYFIVRGDVEDFTIDKDRITFFTREEKAYFQVDKESGAVQEIPKPAFVVERKVEKNTATK